MSSRWEQFIRGYGDDGFYIESVHHYNGQHITYRLVHDQPRKFLFFRWTETVEICRDQDSKTICERRLSEMTKYYANQTKDALQKVKTSSANKKKH